MLSYENGRGCISEPKNILTVIDGVCRERYVLLSTDTSIHINKKEEPDPAQTVFVRIIRTTYQGYLRSGLFEASNHTKKKPTPLNI